MEVKRSAVISDDGVYRYLLERSWAGDVPAWSVLTMVFIGLNPSTADGEQDDPTIERLCAFAEREGCKRLIVGNLFAYRATDPKELRAAADPVGPNNDAWLRAMALNGAKVLAGWGAHPDLRGRDQIVLDLFARVHCLGWTISGQPRHPLYMRRSEELKLFAAGGERMPPPVWPKRRGEDAGSS